MAHKQKGETGDCNKKRRTNRRSRGKKLYIHTNYVYKKTKAGSKAGMIAKEEQNPKALNTGHFE